MCMVQLHPIEPWIFVAVLVFGGYFYMRLAAYLWGNKKETPFMIMSRIGVYKHMFSPDKSIKDPVYMKHVRNARVSFFCILLFSFYLIARIIYFG